MEAISAAGKRRSGGEEGRVKGAGAAAAELGSSPGRSLSIRDTHLGLSSDDFRRQIQQGTLRRLSMGAPANAVAAIHPHGEQQEAVA